MIKNYSHIVLFPFENLFMFFYRLFIGWNKLLIGKTKPLPPPTRIMTDMEAMRANAEALNNDWKIVVQNFRKTEQEAISNANRMAHG